MSHGRFVKAHMSALAALAPTTDQLVYYSGANTPALISLTAAGRALLDDANAAAQLATLGAQAQSDVLDDLAALGVSGSDGQFLVATGAGALAWESGAAARDSIGLGSSDDPTFQNVTASGDLTVSGNLFVSGTKTFVGGETFATASNYQLLNDAYTTNSSQDVGFIANYSPTSTQTTTSGAGVFTAGSNGVSDPTVTTAGSGTFSSGDLILISHAQYDSNVGIYEVHSHSGNTLTIRSTPNGVTNQVESFTNDQFTAETNTGYTITKVNLAILRVDSNGDWEVGKGSTTGITYTDVGGGGGDIKQVSRVTANGTVSAGDEVIMGDTDGGAITAYNLPGSPAEGTAVFFKNVGTSGNNLTIGRNGNNIEGAAADYVLADLEAVLLVYNGTEGWMVF